MPEQTTVVTCPHCGHPYPMSDLQREVYRGRHMGCMACGRPFRVDPPPPPRAEAEPPAEPAPRLQQSAEPQPWADGVPFHATSGAVGQPTSDVAPPTGVAV